MSDLQAAGSAMDPLALRVGSLEAVREVFEEMPIALVGIEGAEQRFSAANAAYRAFTGRTDLIGLPIREVFPEAEGQQIFELFDQIYATARPQAIHEWRIQLDSGPGGASEELYANMTVTPRVTVDGAVQGVTVFLTDVIEPVRQRRAAQREAAEAERRYQAARDVVTELQEALLPDGLPVLAGVSVAARYLVAARDQAAGGGPSRAGPVRQVR